MHCDETLNKSERVSCHFLTNVVLDRLGILLCIGWSGIQSRVWD